MNARGVPSGAASRHQPINEITDRPERAISLPLHPVHQPLEQPHEPISPNVAFRRERPHDRFSWRAMGPERAPISVGCLAELDVAGSASAHGGHRAPWARTRGSSSAVRRMRPRKTTALSQAGQPPEPGPVIPLQVDSVDVRLDDRRAPEQTPTSLLGFCVSAVSSRVLRPSEWAAPWAGRRIRVPSASGRHQTSQHPASSSSP